MEDWQQRLVDESKDLDARAARLGLFIRSPAFQKVENVQRSLLLAQEKAMLHYADILRAHIKLMGLQ